MRHLGDVTLDELRSFFIRPLLDRIDRAEIRVLQQLNRMARPGRAAVEESSDGRTD